MIHRIIEGEHADQVAIAVYNDGLSYKDVSPMDLAPYFVNCVRVFSNLDVVDATQQAEFDGQLKAIGEKFGGILVKHDVGAYLRVIGRPLISISSRGSQVKPSHNIVLNF
jgi:hypothetical protein